MPASAAPTVGTVWETAEGSEVRWVAGGDGWGLGGSGGSVGETVGGWEGPVGVGLGVGGYPNSWR